MKPEIEFEKILHHSIVVTWDGVKQKWLAECIALNLKAEAESYKLLIDELTQALSHAADDLMNQAESKKYPHF